MILSGEEKMVEPPTPRNLRDNEMLAVGIKHHAVDHSRNSKG